MSEKMPSAEEIARIEKSRTLSDAELLKIGAEYVVDEKGEKNGLSIGDLSVKKQRENINIFSQSPENQKRFDSLKNYLKSGEQYKVTIKGDKRGDGYIEFVFLSFDEDGSLLGWYGWNDLGHHPHYKYTEDNQIKIRLEDLENIDHHNPY